MILKNALIVNIICVLMLDEIDCIGLERGHDTGADGELGRTKIALMQACQIVIAATNRADRLDKALIRRFQRKIKFEPFNETERSCMIQKYMLSVNPAFLTDDVVHYADKEHTQAKIIKYLIETIVEQIS